MNGQPCDWLDDMSPEQYAKAATEHAYQVATFMWASQNVERFPVLKWLYAIPNGGERNIIVAGRLRAEGVKSGVSDICLPCARLGYNGLYIELKKMTGKESPAQKEFGAFLTQEGYLYRCCYGWIEAAETLEWYLTPAQTP
jgi:hypothetical protein